MATSRQVTIDDTNIRILYSGQDWFVQSGSRDNAANFGPTYNHTSHGTKSDSSFSFSFEGTSIALIGATEFSEVDNDIHTGASWECSVDKINLGIMRRPPGTALQSTWTLCAQNELADGPHTITVKVMTTGKTFWIDYLLYTPSPRTLTNEAVLQVKSSDPGVTLSTGWLSDQDTIWTDVKGSQAKFNFIGKSVTWVGTMRAYQQNVQALGTFSIDGAPPTPFMLPPFFAGSPTHYHQIIFVTPELVPGPHSIIVTYSGGEKGPARPLTLDYLFMTNTSIHYQPEFPSSTPPPPSTGSNAFSAQIGVIVGGALGGLALIALLAFLVMWRYRRRSHKSDSEMTPFTRTDGPINAGKSRKSGVMQIRQAVPETDVRRDVRLSTQESTRSPPVYTMT